MREFLSSTTEQRAVERIFANATQACADLAQHIATRPLGEATTSRDAIRMLAREDVIDRDPADTLVAAVSFRNVLAHEYGHVDYETVYETLQTGLSVYDTYSQQVAQWVNETN